MPSTMTKMAGILASVIWVGVRVPLDASRLECNNSRWLRSRTALTYIATQLALPGFPEAMPFFPPGGQRKLAKAAYDERFLTTYMPAFREYYEKEGNVNARHDHPILGKLLNHIRCLGG
ncbi:hypothetical protein PPROV_000756500 [Pycnococcus provasolii]|uniref:Uncharacterized protein n=1 Tax=Pycnococcus provasolii TaxID=41880 RepID=A0A830HPH6_9CHLO|nr:hypothetical protein PPROV_000756500 [Pycnococcus provasolii]